MPIVGSSNMALNIPVQQLDRDFTLRDFIDEFMAGGMIPMALTRWEMSGYDDKIKKLW